MYAQLLIDLFKYLAPFLRNVELNKPMQILYKVFSSKYLLNICYITEEGKGVYFSDELCLT